jgi:hypothetical protein
VHTGGSGGGSHTADGRLDCNYSVRPRWIRGERFRAAAPNWSEAPREARGASAVPCNAVDGYVRPSAGLTACGQPRRHRTERFGLSGNA